jgi:hypothetical protein
MTRYLLIATEPNKDAATPSGSESLRVICELDLNVDRAGLCCGQFDVCIVSNELFALICVIRASAPARGPCNIGYHLNMSMPLAAESNHEERPILHISLLFPPRHGDQSSPVRARAGATLSPSWRPTILHLPPSCIGINLRQERQNPEQNYTLARSTTVSKQECDKRLPTVKNSTIVCVIQRMREWTETYIVSEQDGGTELLSLEQNKKTA